MVGIERREWSECSSLTDPGVRREGRRRARGLRKSGTDPENPKSEGVENENGEPFPRHCRYSGVAASFLT